MSGLIWIQYVLHSDDIPSKESFRIVDFEKCRLLIFFANSLDPDQARQNVGPDLDPICLTL